MTAAMGGWCFMSRRYFGMSRGHRNVRCHPRWLCVWLLRRGGSITVGRGMF